jgi:serine/threonine protein kinase
MSSSDFSQMPVICPPTKQFQDWLEGDIELSEEVFIHITSCQKCSVKLAALSDDAQLKSIAKPRHARPIDSFLAEPELAQLRHDLVELPSLLPPSSVVDTDPPPATTEKLQLDQTENEHRPLDKLTCELLSEGLPPERFIVDSLLASGGSGEVYLAFDKNLKRQVAIKVLARDSLKDRQRFLREARLLAELEHTNVVRIFDFGTLSQRNAQLTSQGYLYLVMEYVSGGTALLLSTDRSCWREVSENKDEVNAANGLMTYRKLARLVASAAHGLAAAHHQSLVHRDVKPGNLLLVADWSSLKVADFGLARRYESGSTQVTQSGDILGTPVFMSPEQVSGEGAITFRSDIYSLGASLYQLLTSSPPFQGNSAAILRQIIDVDPPAPRMLNPGVPKDLEVICLRAMDKEPAHRYPSMQSFAEDLIRFADGLPIHARPTTAVTRAYRFLKRNRSLAASLLVSLVLLFSLTIGSVIAAIVFFGQNKELSRSTIAERNARNAAQNALLNSIEAADQLLISVTEDTELLPRTVGSEEVSQKLLDKARKYYEQIVAAGMGNDRIAFDSARARSGLTQIALRLGENDRVESEALATLELLESLPPEAVPSLERTILSVRTLGFLSMSLATRGVFDRAIEVYSQAIEQCNRELVHHPTDNTLLSLLADNLRGRAVAASMSGDLSNAEDDVNRARLVMSDLLESSPNNPSWLRKAAACESTLAATLVRRDGYQVAKDHLLKANAYLSQIQLEGQLPIRIRPDRMKNIVNLASVETRLGNLAEAQALYDQAEEEYEQLILLEPTVAEHRYGLVLTTLNSGNVHIALGNIELILNKYRELEPKIDELLASDPDSLEYLGTLGFVQGNIAVFLRMLDRTEEALISLAASDKTLRVYAAKVNETPDSRYAIALNQYELAKCNLDLHRIDAGLSAIETGMQITHAILRDHPEYLIARMHQVDEWMVKCDLLSDAESVDSLLLRQTAEHALEVANSLVAEFDDLVEYKVAQGVIYSTIADTYLMEGQLAKAKSLATRAVEHLEQLDLPAEHEPLRQAFAWNYLVLAQAVSKEVSAVTESESADLSALRQQLRECVAKCKEYGASPEELSALELHEIP